MFEKNANRLKMKHTKAKKFSGQKKLGEAGGIFFKPHENCDRKSSEASEDSEDAMQICQVLEEVASFLFFCVAVGGCDQLRSAAVSSGGVSMYIVFFLSKKFSVLVLYFHTAVWPVGVEDGSCSSIF